MNAPDSMGWHVISGEHLLSAMRRCVEEDPDLVYAELWANATHNPQDHVYTSTACQHDRHGECRLQCKFCEVPCDCFCHDPVGT